jgi:hypothetical protein
MKSRRLRRHDRLVLRLHACLLHQYRGVSDIAAKLFSIIGYFEDAVRTARTRQKISSSRICGCLSGFRLSWRKPRWSRERRLPRQQIERTSSS